MLMIKSQDKKKKELLEKDSNTGMTKWQIMDINTGYTCIQALNISLPRI